MVKLFLRQLSSAASFLATLSALFLTLPSYMADVTYARCDLVKHIHCMLSSLLIPSPLTCRCFMSARPLGTRVSQLFSKCSSLRFGK